MTNLLLIAMCLVIAFLLYHAWRTEQKVNHLAFQCVKMCSISLSNTAGLQYLLTKDKYKIKRKEANEVRSKLIEYQYTKEGPEPDKEKINKLLNDLGLLHEYVIKAQRAYKQSLFNVKKSNRS